jgi:hypothetical protein
MVFDYVYNEDAEHYSIRENGNILVNGIHVELVARIITDKLNDLKLSIIMQEQALERCNLKIAKLKPYEPLFKEFRGYMKNAKSPNDLDNKDWEDLKKISEGWIFTTTEEYGTGWHKLPVDDVYEK